MSDMGDFAKTWASAAVNTALNPHNRMTHKQIAQTLTKAAAIDPVAIRNKITQLKGQIELLEAYLPEDSRHEG